MSKQIFVIGRNRSGTKWLSNILANHEDISAVQREGAGGILESNLLRKYPKYLNPKNIEERTAFEIIFRESNFHRCSLIEGEILETGQYNDFYDFFVSYMDELANKRGTNFWLQKASSLELLPLVENFPEALFVIIQRTNIFDNVLSSVLLHDLDGKISNLKLFKSVYGYWYHRKVENKYRNKQNAIITSYESLKAYPEKTAEQICNFIGVDFYTQMLNIPYKKNTTFKQKSKEHYYTKWTVFKIKLFSFFASLIPLVFFNARTSLLKREHKKGSLFEPLTFELYRNENEQTEPQ